MPIERVAGSDLGGVYHGFALDYAEHEARDVEVAVGEHAGHLRHLAAYQRTAHGFTGARHAFDQRFYHVGAQDTHVDIVEEQDWLGAADYHVVDAGVYQVFAYAVEASRHHSQL